MYDHLEDPDTPVPGDGALSAVNARAKALHHRRSALAGGSALTVVIVVALVLTNLGGEATKASLVVSSRASPTVVETEAPPPEPTLSPTPEPVATASRLTVAPPTHGPTPTPTCPAGDLPGNCPDGVPGWSGGFGGCDVPASIATGPQSRLIFAGVTATLLSPPALAAGSEGRLTMRLHNGGSSTVSFGVNGTNKENVPLTGPGGTSELDTTDAIGNALPADLAPGADQDVGFLIRTKTCGDTAHDANPPLPAGSYRAGLSVPWYAHVVEPTPSGSPSPTSSTPPKNTVGSIVLNCPVTIS